MPSKNSINRPKNKNTARAKAQHKSSVARRHHQTDIIYGKVDSKKVQQKKMRAARLQAGHEKTLQAQAQDVEMMDDAETVDKVDKIDTRKKKEARLAKRYADKATEEEAQVKEFKADTRTGRGTTLGGPSI